MDNPELVLKVMKEARKPLRAGDIALAAGLEKSKVEKAMKILKDEEKILSPKRCFWEPAK